MGDGVVEGREGRRKEGRGGRGEEDGGSEGFEEMGGGFVGKAEEGVLKGGKVGDGGRLELK